MDIRKKKKEIPSMLVAFKFFREKDLHTNHLTAFLTFLHFASLPQKMLLWMELGV